MTTRRSIAAATVLAMVAAGCETAGVYPTEDKAAETRLVAPDGKITVYDHKVIPEFPWSRFSQDETPPPSPPPLPAPHASASNSSNDEASPTSGGATDVGKEEAPPSSGGATNSGRSTIGEVIRGFGQGLVQGALEVVLVPVVIAAAAVGGYKAITGTDNIDEKNAQPSPAKAKWGACVEALEKTLAATPYPSVLADRIVAHWPNRESAGSERQSTLTIEADLRLVQLTKCQSAETFHLKLAIAARLRDSSGNAPLFEGTIVYGDGTYDAEAVTALLKRQSDGLASVFYSSGDRSAGPAAECRPIAVWCGEGGQELLSRDISDALDGIAVEIVHSKPALPSPIIP